MIPNHSHKLFPMVKHHTVRNKPGQYSKLRLCKVSPISLTTLKNRDTIHIKESPSVKVSPESMIGPSMQTKATLNMVFQPKVSKTLKTSSTQWEVAIKIIQRSPICIGKLMEILRQENKNKEIMTGNSIQMNTDSDTQRKRS